MAAVDPTTKTTYATTDWSHYQRGRPPYPPSLTSLILSYHAQSPNPQYTRLVDVGAGSGIASTPFMPSVSTIHISDPSPSNLSQARAFLTAYAAERSLSPVLEFSQSTGEEAHLHAGAGQADLVICATAAHFIDPDGLAESIAAMLRPGGTMAVFSYWMPSFPGRSRRFAEAFARVFDKLVLAALQAREPEKEPSATRLAKVVERRMTGEGVLDSLPAPGQWFEAVQRVYVNAVRGEVPLRDLFQKFAREGETVGGVSRVRQGEEEVVRFESGRDPEAEGWEFEVDKAWLANFFDTIRPEGDAAELRGEAKTALEEWDAVFEHECPGGKTGIRWPAYVVLARRK